MLGRLQSKIKYLPPEPPAENRVSNFVGINKEFGGLVWNYE
jgi:hypothetical protein